MMQLELIGCTGAGKSTLAAKLFEAACGIPVELVSGDHVALRRVGCSTVKSRAPRTALVHAATLSTYLRHGRQYADFVSVARHSLQTAGITRRSRWHQLRKVLKQLGRYELIRRTVAPCSLALVDEGTLQSAHNVFVHVGHRIDDLQLRRFAACVPLPELAIYVRPAEEELVDRTLRRGHARIARPTRRTVTSFVRQALYAFDEITCQSRIAERTVVIEKGTIVRTPAGCAAPWMHDAVDLIRRALEAHEAASAVR